MSVAMSVPLSFRRSANPRRRLLAILLAAGTAAILAGAPAHDLRAEASAFLRANAGGGVEWLPWGEVAFERAKREQKPVYLNIGVFTSGLSAAMARQSFANADTAAFLNANFVCVLVDREEQPGVAALYYNYIRTVKQLDGWPLNIWLTPELKPYEGANYLPPSEEWGKTSFIKIARQAKDAWTTDAAGCRARANEAVAQLAAPTPALPSGGAPAEKIKHALADATTGWQGRRDAAHGGFGESPKNPEPELLRFLLRQAPADREAALLALRAMAGSALRDPLDGGFFRYAADDAWHVPYPQKTLADQARIALAYLDAAQAAADPAFPAAARGALDFALTHLALPDGTFAAAEDATAEEFTEYYAWTAAEIDTVLGADAAAFKSAHGIEATGNVPADFDATGRLKGKNLLRAALPDTATDAAAATRLRAVREKRVSPPRDDRATTAAHGLLLAALARAGQQLNEPRYRDAAVRTLAAIRQQLMLSPGGDLRHLRGSPAPATPADYAALALGCRELGKIPKQAEAEALAARLLARAGELYFDPTHGVYFAVPATLPAGIVARPPAFGDAPSAESLALLAGAPADEEGALTAGLVAVLENEASAPGDALLALGR